METRDGVVILETETDIAFKEHFDKVVKSLEDKCRENIQLASKIKALEETQDYWEKASDRLQEEKEMLKFELKAADADYQKQIEFLNERIDHLRIENNNKAPF